MKRRHSIILFVPIFVVLLGVDLGSKVWAESALRLGRAGLNLGPVDLTLVHNYGAAFGMGEGGGWLFITVAATIFVAIIVWLLVGKRHGRLEVISLALLAAGAVGNGVDRVIDGCVTDFIQFTFIDFPVINVADACVTCGVILFIISMLFLGRRINAEEDSDQRTAERR